MCRVLRIMQQHYFHNLSATQEYQHCQLCFSSAIKNQLVQSSIYPQTVILICPLISNFIFTDISWWRRKLQTYTNTKLAIMLILPTLCVCEKLGWIIIWVFSILNRKIHQIQLISWQNIVRYKKGFYGFWTAELEISSQICSSLYQMSRLWVRDTEKTFTILQSLLTDSSWIQLIHLIKWMWYKILKKTLLTDCQSVLKTNSRFWNISTPLSNTI